MATRKQQQKKPAAKPAAQKPKNEGLTQEQIRAKHFAIRNARASFDELLRSWGIPLTPAVDQFVAQAAQKQMSGDAFMAAIRKTKAYARAFPGIMQPNGVLRMSEAEYQAGFEAVQEYGNSIGRVMNKAEFAMALKNGNSVAEVKQKWGAIDSLLTNGAILDQFVKYRQSQGLSAPENREDMLKFVMGLGPREWEVGYDQAVAGARAKTAGLRMSFDDIKQVIGAIETSGLGDIQDITPEVYAKVRDNLRHVGTMKQYGIKDKDAVLAAFGIGEKRDLVNDVVKNAEAFAAGTGRVEEDPFSEAQADRFTQGEKRRSGASL